MSISKIRVSIEKKKLDLRVNWKLSRNETLYKENFFITITDGKFSGTGEIAPNIRYQENEELILENFSKFQKLDLESLSLQEHIQQENFCHSFKFGASSAVVHFHSQRTKRSIHELLGIDAPESISTSFSIPIMEEEKLPDYIESIKRFSFIKVKINKDNAISFVKEISRHTDKPLRVDGNEAWDSLGEYLEFENAVKELNIQFIEQPFKASMVETYQKLKPISLFEIMADESIESDVDMKEIGSQFHSVNIKLMKASSYQNAISLLREAKKYNLKTMIGCMIESSLGISSALQISSLGNYFDLDGSLLLKNDPYNLTLESEGSLRLN
jgi:L-alanine-DL-glutamate epimerase-like enolase superfamily enzyme